MSVDFNLLGRGVKSFNDYQSEAADLQNRQQALKLQQGQLAQLPLHEQLLRLQLSGAELANQQSTQQANLLAPIMARLAGGSSAQPINALGSAQSAPTNAFAPPPPQGGPTQGGNVPFPLSFGEVTALKLGGLPDLTSDYKMALEGVSHAPGSEVTGVDGSRRIIPTLDKGMQLGPDGQVSYLPGFVDSSAGLAGRTKAAEVAGGNSQTMAPESRLGPDNRPVNMTVGQLVAGTGAPNPLAPPQPTPPAISQLSPAQQAAALTDMAQRGQDPSTMKVNGAPAFGDMQAQLDAAKQGGPAAIQRFVQTVAPSLKGDPKLMAGLAYDLHTPIGTPIHAMGGAPSAPAGGSPFAGPADTARAVEGAKAEVQLKTKPALDYATDTAKAAADYKGKLDDTVSTSQDLMQRVAEAKDALSKFTPGMGAEGRLQIARAAQSMSLPESLVTKINNGDVAAKQEFVKLSAQTAMEALKTSLGGSGRITQAEFSVFQKNNPNISLDPNAIAKIYDFTTRMYQKTLAEQQGYSKYLDQGGDPAKWRSKFAAASDPTASGNIVIPGAAPKASQPKSANDPLGLR